MKQKLPRRRGLSLLLALAMVLSLAPAAFAATVRCPECNSTNCTKTTVAEANCHEGGVDRYVCKNCGKTTLVETAEDKNNHDARYTTTATERPTLPSAPMTATAGPRSPMNSTAPAGALNAWR